ncbi:MAG TPA: TonB-dependent receptor [Burkholderiaceae bacterium]|nr:TonB-dependent receptor [Burkholderiaceae bacterium]HMX11671.1 TonB-dependent receptor [Burkholderiaceae bacterium]HMZ00818.1 TonB-dependent receptor [Burkholderiaceae bacterium]HNG78154.1 TonB-dependent receptor [Burkholderiaceae bacterium]
MSAHSTAALRRRARSVTTPHTTTPFKAHPLAQALAATLALMAGAAGAQTTPASTPASTSTSALAGSDATTFEIGRVVIAGRSGPLSARQLLTSVDVVSGELLQGDALRNTWEVFRRVPGVQLTEFNQGTTSGKVSLRGFNGEGEVNAVKLLIDGIPSNSNDGNMPYLDLIAPLDIATITTVRGTNDARFGLHNIAGNIDIATRTGGNDGDARLGVGSWGLVDAQVVKGIDSGDWSQNYSLAARRADGWRDHAESKKVSLAGKWFYQGSADWRVGLSARHHQQDADEPGYLTYAASRADPSQSASYSAFDGGERRIDQVGLHADLRLTDTLTLQGKVYVNRFFDDRFVRFSETTSQQERLTDETHRGARLSSSWRPAVSGLASLAIEGGLDSEQQHNISQRYTTTARTRVSETRSQEWDFDTVGGFVQAVIEPVKSLKLVPGWRVDQISGSFTNYRVPATYAINDYGSIRQPKISAVWSPLAGQSLYANWGRSFQVGVGAASYKVPPRSSDLAPSINDGWETGWKFQDLVSAIGLSGRLALWQQKASNEVMRRLNDPSGDSDNIGATRRRGVDLQLRARASTEVQTWLAYGVQKAVIVTPDPAAPDTQGNEVDHVPRRLYSAGIDWQSLPTLRLSASLQGQGDYELTRSNDHGRWGGYTLLNLGASWQPSPSWEVSAEIKNVTNRYNEYVWWETNSSLAAGGQTLHSPGAPRSLGLALRVHL